MEVPEFEEFFRLMFPKLVRYAQRKTDPAAAEDLAAAALQTIWSKDLESPQGDIAQRKLQSFAYRILDGLIRNAHRATATYNKALKAASAEQRVKPASIDLPDLVPKTEWPQWAQPLSMTDRDVLDLVVDGYKVAEIAVILDCKPGAVTMRLQRAKRNARLLWFREVQREQEA